MDQNARITKLLGEVTQQTIEEQQKHLELKEYSLELIKDSGFQWNMHNLATMKRQTLSRILYLDHLYSKILNTPGVICEFGVHWGSTIAQLINLRGIYEPYNYSRHIYGFDTFTGFEEISEKDSNQFTKGDYSSGLDHQERLEKILEIQEFFSPINHLKKFSLIQGDASETIIKWLIDNPATLISLAIFDMDVYKPTKDVLSAILPRLMRGSILVFDELNCPHFPGETLALLEVLELKSLKLQRYPHQPFCAWVVYGES